MSTEVLSSVSERRLRPIYELLDTGNYKKAFHEAEKVLKKQKDLLAAKVLKTIALHRLGKSDEAFSLACEVVKQEPIDENSLQGLTLYYKECHKTELICPLYEKATKKCPQNEEYLTHLFMSYVRHDKFQDMQRVAMNLYKQHPKNPYLFWGIMAIVLQAENVEDRSLAKTMYLPLAEKMIEKHIKQGKIDAEAEVRLYVIILELMEKYEQALEVLRGNLGKKLSFDVIGFTPRSIELEEKLQRWDIVNPQYKKLLKENPDAWNYVLGYLHSFFQLLNQDWKPENNDHHNSEEFCVADYKVEHAYKFVGELVKQQDNLHEGKCRGPYLMRLELIKRLKKRQEEKNDVPVSQASVKQLLLEYALDFSTKPCCTWDLKPHFPTLPSEDIDVFLEELYKQQATFTFDDVTKDFPAKLKPEINKRKQKEFHRHIFTVEATRFLGGHENLSDDKKFQMIEFLLKKYQDGICFCDDQLDTDPRIIDNYCLNIVRLLFDLYEKHGDIAFLWRSIIIMEQTLKESKSNYEIKILLIKVYCLLGVFSPCADFYDSLEIKHIQQNTLGYLVCQDVLSLGHYFPASQVFQISRNFFLSNTKESVECLITCFRNGTFQKVIEFVEYCRHISNSMQSALTHNDHVLMDLFTQGNIDQPVANLLETVNMKRINFDKLVDDRDFSVISDVNIPEKQVKLEDIEQSFVELKTWGRFREILVQLSILILTPQKPMQVNGHTDLFAASTLNISGLIEELEIFCQQHSTKLHGMKYKFCGPQPSPLSLACEAKYPQNMLLLFRTMNSLLCTKDIKEIPDVSENLNQILNNIQDFMKTFCDGVECDFDSSILKEEFRNSEIAILAERIPNCLLALSASKLKRMVLCVEMFSLTILIFTNIKQLISETKSTLQRMRRRKKGKPGLELQEPRWIKTCQEVNENFKSLAEELISIIKKINLQASKIVGETEKFYEKPNNGESDDDEEFADENIRQLVMKIVQSTSESFVVSCKQTLTVVEGRLENLKEMKF